MAYVSSILDWGTGVLSCWKLYPLHWIWCDVLPVFPTNTSQAEIQMYGVEQL